MTKTHFGVPQSNSSICGLRTSVTHYIQDVDCKNCLRLIKIDLEMALDNAYPNRIRNKKTGTTLNIRPRKMTAEERSEHLKNIWTELKKLPIPTDEELLRVIETAIDRGYKYEWMTNHWGKGIRLVFIPDEIRADLKELGYQYWRNGRHYIKRIERFIEQKKLRLVRAKTNRYHKNYDIVKRPVKRR